jgi:hypothetical protein
VESKGWVNAEDLKVGDDIGKADGSTGKVESITTEKTSQEMYNLTVDEAHTFFVGDGQWLVHNCADRLTTVQRLIDATNRQAEELRATLSRSQRGPVLTGVAHPLLDEVYFGLNHSKPPSNLPQVLQELDAAYTIERRALASVNAGVPGTHSEIYALADAIHALEDLLGREITQADLPDFYLTNRYLLAPRLDVIDRCDHCLRLTEGVTTILHR